ncbi:MAG TPA: helix-turn-helix domain-containing protein, partial [Myxococcales bacterium]|nr:helix-turn-helix domain-containing protein [Myxococcales bacterium]
MSRWAVGLMMLVASGCAAVSPAPSPAACGEADPRAEGAPGELTAAMRTDAVLAVLRGCDREKVARRYGVTADVLQQWTHLFVGSGRSALIPTTPATPAKLQDAWRGTWVLRSRIARGKVPAKADGIMLFADAESLTVEAGVLQDEFAELPLGPQAGQPFRLAQYSRLMYVQR